MYVEAVERQKCLVLESFVRNITHFQRPKTGNELAEVIYLSSLAPPLSLTTSDTRPSSFLDTEGR